MVAAHSRAVFARARPSGLAVARSAVQALARRAVRELARQGVWRFLAIGDPKLNEPAHWAQAHNGSWVSRGPWRQSIGSVDDLEGVAGKIGEAFRPVAGEA
jgi:hypothetical protein